MTNTMTNTYALLPNGTFTLHSLRTGDHRTLQIKTQATDAEFMPGRRLVGMLVGPDNESSYTGIGMISADGNGIQIWRKFRGTATEAAANILWDLAVKGGPRWGSRFTLHQSRSCVRCNRKLTTPESIDAGIGPICAGRE